MNLLRWLLVVALLSGLTACTDAVAGTPRPDPSAPAPSSRPREVRLDTVDPCTLITEADYRDYYLDEPGKPERDDNGSAVCAWDGAAYGFFDIVLQTHEGIEVWLDGSRNGRAEEIDPVLDFPAISIVLAGDENYCRVGVDVADGQTLLVSAGYDLTRPVELPPVCEYAHQFATSVMTRLLDQ